MKIGVIGAGTMGSGIAQAFAQTEGYEVALCDINEEFAANGKKKIAKGFEKRIAKGKMTQEDADKILAKITTGVKDICGDCDLIIEAAIENMEIKKQTFKELDAICKADCIFATNTSSLSIVGVSAPAFWVAIILQIVFGLKLNILPISGFDSAASYILPSVALGARYAGSMARITRTSMLEVLNQDYIRTARAKGAKRWSVILKHALKNAMIPIVTLVGTDFGYMLTGSMLIEKVFSIPGIGKLAVDAMSNRDLPLLEGTVMYIAFVFVIVNLLVDISYAFLDPRIRYGKGAA